MQSEASEERLGLRSLQGGTTFHLRTPVNRLPPEAAHGWSHEGQARNEGSRSLGSGSERLRRQVLVGVSRPVGDVRRPDLVARNPPLARRPVTGHARPSLGLSRVNGPQGRRMRLASSHGCWRL